MGGSPGELSEEAAYVEFGSGGGGIRPLPFVLRGQLPLNFNCCYMALLEITPL